LVNENIFVGYDSNKLEVWDGKSMNCKFKLDLEKSINKISTLEIDPSYLILALQNGNIMIFSTKTNQSLGMFSNDDSIEK
jgi:hypothetical protein